MALIYCPECGKQVSDSADACPNCGYPVRDLRKDGDASGSASAADYSKPEQGKYNVFLTDAGDSVTGTAQILCDVCGYEYQDAYDLASNLPTIVVYNATLTQAKAAANALADYGLDVSVYDDNGYVDFDDLEYDEKSTTKTDNGIEISADLARILNTLTINNLIRSACIRSYSYPYPYEYVLPYRRRHLFYYEPPRYRPTFIERLFGLAPRGYAPRPSRPMGGGPRPGGGRPSGGQRPAGGSGGSAPSRPSGSSRSFGSGSGSFRSGSRTSGSSGGSSSGSRSGGFGGSSSGSRGGSFGSSSSRSGGLGGSRSSGGLFGGGSRSSGSRSGGFGSSSSRSSGLGGSRSSGVGRVGGSSKGGGFGGRGKH